MIASPTKFEVMHDKDVKESGEPSLFHSQTERPRPRLIRFLYDAPMDVYVAEQSYKDILEKSSSREGFVDMQMRKLIEEQDWPQQVFADPFITNCLNTTGDSSLG